MTFVAIGPLAWGKSDVNKDIAIQEAKKRIPRSMLNPGRYQVTVYAVDEFLGVSGVGGIEYMGAKPRELDSVTVQIRRR